MAVTFDETSHTAWISQGFERLADRVRQAPTAIQFDVLIIGSGYGGAMAAATLAGRTRNGIPISVAVLERGNEYVPGTFPTGLTELPRHIRQQGNRQGLFDVRIGEEVNTVVANGIGGGSLINAGVMETPLPGQFAENWPAELSSLSNWSVFYERAAEMLGARTGGNANTIEKHVDGIPKKHSAIRAIEPDHFRPAEITVAMDDRTNAAGVKLKKCVRCGDCATGCNFGAKESLDVGLLAKAHRAGVEVFSGATVLHVEQTGDHWMAKTVYTDATLRSRDGNIHDIRARKIIIAAGTLGSNEILMRSQNAGLPVSDRRLGKQCSTNGDMLAADFATDDIINNIADQAIEPSGREIGPTITGVIDLREDKGVLIEEISVPASLRVAFSEVFGSVNALHHLEKIDWSRHRNGFPNDDGYAVPDSKIKQTAVYAIMGDDGAAGHIELEDRSSNIEMDGNAVMRWPTDAEPETFALGVDTLDGLTKNTGGRLIANPAWRLLPEDLSFLIGGQRGPVTTVHPLGGLVMADSPSNGVVDPLGRVYQSGTSNAVYDDLVVLDGSIVPTALGTNPALTIAALALRATEALADMWGFDQTALAPLIPKERPVFRGTDKAFLPEPTEVEVIERLWGEVQLKPIGGVLGNYVIELTIRFEPKAVPDLNPAMGGDCILSVSDSRAENSASSQIRIFAKSDWDDLAQNWNPPIRREQELNAIAKFRAPLTGTLKVLEREESRFLGRVWRAGKAWLLNRGLRDTYQAVFHGESEGQSPGFFSRIKSGIAIASRAGEVRKLVYELDIGPAEANASVELDGTHISGVKRFTYNRCGNPWRQLMDVALDEFPGRAPGKAPILKLDLAYLARIGVPLFRITKESDGVTAIADLTGFFGYFIRLLLGIHVWSFRLPDPDLDPTNDEVVFKPPKTITLSNGETVNADIICDETAIPDEKPDMAQKPDLIPGKVHITRYPNPNTTKRPVVTFHGYSAGGTTYAHHAVNPNFASHLWESGRDVWVSDLRTSPLFAQTTATQPWSFEQIANTDVPYVIRQAAAASIDGKVDVVAHCMGTIVFSMAVLNVNNNQIDPLWKKIGRVSFIQVGPLVVFSPINILRGYVMRYLLEFLPDNYQFKPDNPGLVDNLLDRVLATLPYPEEEFRIENPVWPCKRTPWTRTRHRMDALYGRDFSAANMEPGVLKYIDEHFGALSLRTVGSTLHYARHDMMTDHHGRNQLVSRHNFDQYWKFPTFSVHGGDNGLSDVATVNRMTKILHDSGVEYMHPHVIPGAGHQDVLIGTARQETFDHVTAFLDAEPVVNPFSRGTDKVAYPPWIGPIMTVEAPPPTAPVIMDTSAQTCMPAPTANIARIGSAPSHRHAEGAVLLRVHVSDNQILRADDMSDNWDEAYLDASMAIYRSSRLAASRWDAFEILEPCAMPNSAANNNGNATLVLVIYDESSSLAERTEGPYLKIHNNQVVSFNRNSTVFYDVPSQFTTKQFQQMRNAVRHALLQHDATTRSMTNQGAEGLVLQGRRDITRLVVDPTIGEGIRVTTGTEPIFGQAADANSVLSGINSEDLHLFNGIVPDRPVSTEGQFTRFAFGSCQYPAGMLDGPVTYRTYDALADRLTAGHPEPPRFMLFIGDQIYADATAGLFDPIDKDDRYRIPYVNWLRAPGVRTALRSAPSYMLLDDHEIYDNYEPAPNLTAQQQIWFAESQKAYDQYQHGLNRLEKNFAFDGFDFFLLDTRTRRKHRKVGNLAVAEMVDANTLSDLLNWLSSTDRPKFVVSPSMFLPRHRRAVQRDTTLDPFNLSALHSDGWDGYPGSMNMVLGHIADKGIRNVVFLSGDEHRASIANAEIFDTAGQLVTTIKSIHTAAMWAPFPFANALDEDILEDDEFAIKAGAKQFTCKVHSWRPPPGDGPTYVTARMDGPDWKVDCEFAEGVIETLVL